MTKIFIHWHVFVTSSGSFVVEKLLHQPKFEDMTPTTARSKKMRKMETKLLYMLLFLWSAVAAQQQNIRLISLSLRI